MAQGAVGAAGLPLFSLAWFCPVPTSACPRGVGQAPAAHARRSRTTLTHDAHTPLTHAAHTRGDNRRDLSTVSGGDFAFSDPPLAP